MEERCVLSRSRFTRTYKQAVRGTLFLVTLFLGSSGGSLAVPPPVAALSPRLAIQKGDRITVVGDHFTQSMQRFGYFETLLQAAAPSLDVTVRYSDWPGATSDASWPTCHERLTRFKTDVILLCVGTDELPVDAATLARWADAFQGKIDEFLKHSYNNASPPRMALISPLAFDTSMGEGATVTQLNQRCERLTDKLAVIAATRGVTFADVFRPTRELLRQVDHVTWTNEQGGRSAYGDWLQSQILLDQLRWLPRPHRIILDADSRKLEGEGVETGPCETTETGWAFTATDQTPPPPAPPSVLVQAELLAAQPRFYVNHLAPGRYSLVSQGRILVPPTSATEWERGVQVLATDGHRFMDELREAVIAKDQQETSNEADHDRQIWKLAERRAKQVFELKRVGSK